MVVFRGPFSAFMIAVWLAIGGTIIRTLIVTIIWNRLILLRCRFVWPCWAVPITRAFFWAFTSLYSFDESLFSTSTCPTPTFLQDRLAAFLTFHYRLGLSFYWWLCWHCGVMILGVSMLGIERKGLSEVAWLVATALIPTTLVAASWVTKHESLLGWMWLIHFNFLIVQFY